MEKKNFEGGIFPVEKKKNNHLLVVGSDRRQDFCVWSEKINGNEKTLAIVNGPRVFLSWKAVMICGEKKRYLALEIRIITLADETLWR